MANSTEKKSPTEILEALTALLGSPSVDEDKCSMEAKWLRLPWEKNITHHSSPQPPSGASTQQEEEGSCGCDFSSFPSLSLQRKPGAVEDADPDNFFHQKEGVQAHVASLLSRPILVSNDPEKREEEDDDDEGAEFVEEIIAKVPQLMQQNLVLSFSTLVQSRLRAYASFLARHGLSLVSESSGDLEDGVVCVEQKLETLLGLGNLVALGDVQMAFQGQPNKGATTSDAEELRATMPLSLKASISVLIPTLEGRQDCHTIDLQTSGSITGIFTKATALRVVQVDLDMPQLVTSMKEGAASTVSRIVEMTNATYSVPLPRVLSTDWAAGEPADDHPKAVGGADRNRNNKRPHLIEDDCAVIITPDFASTPSPKHPSGLDLQGDLEEDLSALSPDKCGKIVDSLFDTIDVSVLSPPSKRARFSPTEEVDGIDLTRTLPVV